jgi:prepilin-type N-terminal cleavage/methylation domain-containing protein
MLKRYNNIENSQGFTLIELMVGIAIVGLLSSVILVATKGSTDKANIAKTMQWSRSIESLLGPYAVGIWNFDEGSGTTVSDLSGYGNDGTIYGASYTTDTPSGHGYALEFNGVDDYVEVSDDSSLDVTDTVSLGAWINQTGEAISRFQRVTDKNGAITMWLQDDNSNAHVRLTADKDEVAESVGFSTGIQKNIWYHLFFTYDKDATDGRLKFYLDGELLSTSNYYYGSMSTRVASLIIGNWGGVDRPWKGQIDDVRIYNRALDYVQTKALYYAGLENLYNKGLMGEREYEERILAGIK